jgi:large subunit ribosomal protein L21
MYAVIKIGGKQQRVSPGDVIEAERIGEETGASVTFTPLLVVDDEGNTHLGKDLEKASVTAKLVSETKGDKVRVVKFKNKTRYTRHKGHRQLLSRLEVGEIKLPGGGGGKKVAAPKAAAKAEPPETPVTEGEIDVESEGGE